MRSKHLTSAEDFSDELSKACDSLMDEAIIEEPDSNKLMARSGYLTFCAAHLLNARLIEMSSQGRRDRNWIFGGIMVICFVVLFIFMTTTASASANQTKLEEFLEGGTGMLIQRASRFDSVVIDMITGDCFFGQYQLEEHINNAIKHQSVGGGNHVLLLSAYFTGHRASDTECLVSYNVSLFIRGEVITKAERPIPFTATHTIYESSETFILPDIDTTPHLVQSVKAAIDEVAALIRYASTGEE